ncbi:hypothetical protein CIK05_08510 [Bdellovibrio sp. qaytius]|nr:hypothetical protein CIK05_08510 [Bdellovibrio sp. qaytius]
MNGSLKFVQAMVFLTLVGAMFTSCGGSQTTLSSTTASGTTTGGNTGSSSGASTIEDEEKNATIPAGYDASNLFVAVADTMDYTRFTSIYSNWGQKCTFTSASIVNDITCVVNVGELAIYHEGIKLQFNIPANKCDYFETKPYWFYNHETGYGPSSISATVTVISGTVVSQKCQVNSGTIANCNGAPPTTEWNDINWVITESAASAECVYDNTISGGQNCCLGKYNSTIKMIVDGVPVTTPSKKEWGGVLSSCIAGPGKTDWTNKSADGVPLWDIQKMETGKSRTKIMKASAPIDTSGAAENISIANYFTPGLHNHVGYGAMSGTTSIYPYYMDPISDRSGSYMERANPFYTFDCMDEAFEVNQRIRVMIQEWDTEAALSSYIANGTSGTPVYGTDTGTADEPGKAPGACPGLSGENCNTNRDADDFVGLVGPYSTASPVNRANYFPDVPSK